MRQPIKHSEPGRVGRSQVALPRPTEPGFDMEDGKMATDVEILEGSHPRRFEVWLSLATGGTQRVRVFRKRADAEAFVGAVGACAVDGK